MRDFGVLTAVFLLLACAPASTQNKPACDCCNQQPTESTVCLTDAQMSKRVKHIEMENDLMGNHVNIDGIAAFQIVIGEDGHIVCAKAISGNPIAITLLMNAMNKWRLKPLVRNKLARRACGQLKLRFSIVENLSTVSVVRP
jgi:hypothetical protein